MTYAINFKSNVQSYYFIADSDFEAISYAKKLFDRFRYNVDYTLKQA
jgi:hypothetical protein